MIERSDASHLPEECGPSGVELRGLPIAEVSRLLGVPIPTLRSWELRYGIPPTERSPGKHRRYSPMDLHTLRLMRDEVSRGKRAGLAAEAVRELLGSTGPATPYVAAVLDASERGDAVAIRAHLGEAQDALGLGTCLDDVLMPAMQQVGAWWQTGRCTVDDEHLTTAAVRAWMRDVNASAPEPVRTTPIVLACGPADLHSVGLEALGVLLGQEGWSSRLLGARTSVAQLTATVQATGADGVVIVSHLGSNRSQAVESLRAAARAGVAGFYAGNAFSARRSRRNVPGLFLGNRLQQAVEIITTELS